jgi:hypothetical protein
MTYSAAPVFIFGALRSGTTVFRLMLDAHEGIWNPGEFDFLFRCLHEGGDGVWRYDLEALRKDRVFNVHGMQIDETLDGPAMLADFIVQIRAKYQRDGVFTINLHTGADKMAALMPGVRVIHMLRDPRDVARSSIGMGWAATPYFGVGHWIKTEAEWDRAEALITPENRMTLRYEALFRDIETELRRVCAFLGVSFSPAMLRYHKNTTYGPPDLKLVEQWRRKATKRELQLIEGRVGGRLASRGYAPSGEPPASPGALEKQKLRIADVYGCWLFSVRRYGIWLATAERIARRLKLRGAHRRLRLRMNDIQQRIIK